MIERHGKPIDYKQALAVINRGSKELNKAVDTLQEMAEPQTLIGKGRHYLVGKLPVFLRDRLRETAMSTLQASLREVIIETYTGFGVILQEGKEINEFAGEVSELLLSVKEDPESSEKAELLRERLMSRVEGSLDFNKDVETDRWLSELEEREEVRDPGAATRRLMSQAENFLANVGPALAATEATLLGAKRSLDGLCGVYATVYTLRPLLDNVARTSQGLIEGERLGISAPLIIKGQIEQAIKAVELASQAAEIRMKLGNTVNQRELSLLRSRAQKLLSTPQE